MPKWRADILSDSQNSERKHYRIYYLIEPNRGNIPNNRCYYSANGGEFPSLEFAEWFANELNKIEKN